MQTNSHMSTAASVDCVHCAQTASTAAQDRPACLSCATLIGALIGKKQMALDVNVAEVPEANWLSESLVAPESQRTSNIDMARERVRSALIARASSQGRPPQVLIDQYDRMAQKLNEIADNDGNAVTRHGVDANTRKIDATKAARALISLFDKWVSRNEKDADLLRNFYEVVITVLMRIRRENRWAARNLFKTVVRPFGTARSMLSVPFLGGVREQIGEELAAQIDASLMQLIADKRRDYDDEESWGGESRKGGDKKRMAPRDPRNPSEYGYSEKDDPSSWPNTDLDPDAADRKFNAQQRDAFAAYNAYGNVDFNTNPEVLALRPLPGSAFIEADDEDLYGSESLPAPGGGIGGDPDDGGDGGPGRDDDSSDLSASDDDESSDSYAEGRSVEQIEYRRLRRLYAELEEAQRKYDRQQARLAVGVRPDGPLLTPPRDNPRFSSLTGRRTGVVPSLLNEDARPLSDRRVVEPVRRAGRPARPFSARKTPSRPATEVRPAGRPKGSTGTRRWTWEYPENLQGRSAADAAAPPQAIEARFRVPGTQVGAGGKKFSVAKMRKELLRYYAAARRGGEFPRDYWYGFGKGVADVAVSQYSSQIKAAGQRFGEFVDFLSNTGYLQQKVSSPKLTAPQMQKNLTSFLNDKAYRATPNYSEFFLQVWEMYQHYLRADRDLRTNQKSANQFRVDVSNAFRELYRAVINRVSKVDATPQALLDNVFVDMLEELKSVAPGYQGVRYSTVQKKAGKSSRAAPPPLPPRDTDE